MTASALLRTVTCLAVLTCTSGAALANGSSIEQARALARGTSVTVVGVAISAAGDFSPNDNGFALADRRAGIYVADSLGLSIEVGQTVRVTGVIGATFGGVLSVVPSNIVPVGTARVPAAQGVRTSQISEATEGKLVKIRGAIVSPLRDDAPYGVHFAVDDGSGPVVVFVTAGTGIDTSALEEGQRVQIEGVSGQFGDHYEVTPVSQADIRTLPARGTPGSHDD